MENNFSTLDEMQAFMLACESRDDSVTVSFVESSQITLMQCANYCETFNYSTDDDSDDAFTLSDIMSAIQENLDLLLNDRSDLTLALVSHLESCFVKCDTRNRASIKIDLDASDSDMSSDYDAKVSYTLLLLHKYLKNVY